MNQKGKNNKMMDYTKKIIPILWNFLDTRKNSFSISINICMMDDEVIVSVINREGITRFKHTENLRLVENLNTYLQSC